MIKAKSDGRVSGWNANKIHAFKINRIDKFFSAVRSTTRARIQAANPSAMLDAKKSTGSVISLR